MFGVIMKKLIIMLTIATSISSFNARAFEIPAGALTIAVGALFTTASISILTADNKEVAIINAVNADAQNFYQTGRLSIAFKQAIDLLKAENCNLSDTEAVDLIVQLFNE